MPFSLGVENLRIWLFLGAPILIQRLPMWECMCPEAISKNIPVKTYTVPLNDVDRAITEGEEQGFFKITIREGSDKIIGATVVSQHAGDLIGQLSMAITCGVGLSDLHRSFFLIQHMQKR